MKNRFSLPMSENPWLLRSLVAAMFLTVALLCLYAQNISPISTFTPTRLWSSSSSRSRGEGFGDGRIPAEVSSALLHYATTTVIPQQNRGEIDLSVKVLSERSPCNFLVFGLGHDSPLWNALNFKGKTVFLEEDFNWIKETVKRHPQLEKKAYQVKYPTTLSQADNLLGNYRSSSSCNPRKQLRGSTCKLALANLPREIYETEWDVIMIDAPRGYFDAAPGRMTAIFSAAVMAKNRKKEGATDIFLHDVDRRVEKMYAHEFLCKQNLVASSGRLWRFMIAPSPSNATTTTGGFCP